jgi:ABC-type multidrug transport system ATPase subunit
MPTDSVTLELANVAFQGSSAGRLGMRSSAARVGLVGDWEPLFRGFLRRESIAQGNARVLGLELGAALASGRVGLALCDPPLPLDFSVRQYLEQAAGLSHGSTTKANSQAHRALDRFGLTAVASRRLDQLQLFQRRALGIALAALGEPELCAIETPLRGLDAQAADYVVRLVTELGRSSRIIVSCPLPGTPSPERSLLDACDELFVFVGGELVADGAPSKVFAQSGRYLISVAGERVPELLRTLEAAGCELVPRARPGSFRVTLPERQSSDLLLDSALDTGVVVHELEPLLLTQSAVGSGLAAL